jgi:hypothetical protein
MTQDVTEDAPDEQATEQGGAANSHSSYRDHLVDRTGELLEQVIEVARSFPRVGTGAIPDPRDGTVAPVTISAEGVRKVDPSIFDAYRVRPLLREGTATVSRLDSLIDLTNRHADDEGEEGALFVDEPVLGGKSGSITAIIDYHGTDGQPNNCGHRVCYPFPLSPEWKAWMAMNDKPFEMIEFAQFLEDRIVDVLDPSAADTLPQESKDYIKKAGGKLGSPTKLIEISRSLQVNENSRVKSAQVLSSGERQIVFETEHTDAAGQPVDVPSLFLIAIPVFANSPVAFRMIVRLRYRVRGGISFFYEVWRPDIVLKTAVDEAVKAATDGTSLPVFYGQPE